MAVAATNRLPLAAFALLIVGAVPPALVAQTFERGPTHSPHGPLTIPCSSCHTEKNWKTMRAVPEFNHNTQTSYPLRGMHEGVKCSLCHTKLVFKETSTRCADCHADIHRRQFGADCAQCHTVKGWTVAVQNIRDHLNRFPLLGAHAMVECDACHTGAASGQFTGLSTACESCHMRDFNRTTDPAHVAAGFSTNCQACHNFDTFLTATFDHSTTGFPLTGAHIQLPCASCHVGNRFKGTSATCIGCHNTDFTSAKNPDHVQSGFSTDCAACHSTVTWAGAKFDHSTTKFPLTGAHVSVACETCHVNNNFVGLPTACISCHLKDEQGTTNPNHVSAGFPQDCSICHSTVDWNNASFNHTTQTKFPLTGAHVQVACNTCHVNNVFAGLSMACASCHLKDFQGATNPNHVAAGFPQDCSVCHTTTDWSGAVFNHTTQTKFPLTGAHANVACNTCHVNNVFAGLSMNCVGCHLKDFQGATNPNHVSGNFSQDCQLCHNTTDWTNATFDHNKTSFPLTGAHVSVACATCHVNNVFAGLSTACISCHLKDEQGTTNPNHVTAGFPQDCSMCHTTTDWSGASFNHTTQTKFPLTGSHINVACATCHVNNVFAGLSTACISCHLKDEQGTTSPNHVSAGLPQDCSLCHTTVDWSGAVFDHSKTQFPLTGAHTNVQCATCHVNNVFAGLSTACISCHLTDEKGTTDPNHVAAGFPQDCSLCHTTLNWSGATFNHTTQTKFPLTGAHINVPCSTCHVNNVFAGLSTACVSCHLKDEQSTTNPNHIAGGLPTDCQVCHTTTNWDGAVFDHSKTPFPLTGAHVNVQCATCHVNNVFAGLSTACVSCHLKDEQGTTNPNHVAAGFPTDCSLCHSTTNWLGANFNHTTQTKFPLTGAHTNVPCATCHVNNVFAGLPMTCISCHLKDFQGTTNPNHVASGISQDCQVCHTTTNWDGAVFDHSKTQFPLTGAHVNVACATCHVNNVFAGLSTACISCHLKDEQGTTNPPHVAGGFPQDCSMCHSTTNWLGATFNHTTQTKFPLTGAHINVACATCHVNNVFAGLSMACISCHLKDWQGANDPNHVAAAFPQTCDTCHTTTNWQGATFNHTTQTKFPLTGAHTTVDCNLCHVNNVYAGLSTACLSCHLKDEQGTTNPNHVAAGFPTDCSMCHTTTNWLGATFNHTTQTKFPLTGAHMNVPCATCHVNNVFAGLSTTCVSCHLKDEQGTTNPNHIAAGFPTDCSTCHTTTNWDGATFNHTTQTKFPLTGAHVSVACATCHLNNVFAGLSTACVSCHLKDEQGTTNPNHIAGGFPTDCSMCHTTTNWLGATFNHNSTPFPLTGAHVNVACATCHVNNVFAGLSTACVSCHLKDEQGTTNPNHIAAGFPTDCSTCHTTANWDGATFNHTTQTKFPLTGAHVNVACSTCHVNNVFAGLSTACVSCHLKDYTGTTDPNHPAAAFAQTCDSCHTTTNWLGATFNHTTQTKFPLTGAHVSLDCNLCHKNNVFAGLSTACYSCHQADFTGATNPNHVSAGFPQDCTVCHTTTNWTGATFNHNNTPFPLTGAHVNVACATCHVNNVFAGLAMTCISCHLKDEQGTTNPNHIAAGFPTDCSTCHTTTDWTGATFNHTTQTKFPLTGAHVNVACATCHVNNVFAGLSTACYSCHQADFTGTTNPNHVSAGFPTDCSVCHSTTDWSGAVFDHSKTPFPLTGAHVNVACATCHVNNVFAGLATTCISCHLKDYNGTTNPNHAALGYPQDCTQCHTTTDFTSSTFNHTASTFPFPLTGAHVTVPCASCHVNGNFTTTPTDCYSCHATDYTGTTNPNHTAAGFPTTCATCHTTTAWTGATFNHTYFPMTHGNAKVCSDCHTNSSDYSVFQCTGCHTANNTNGEHSGVRNYVYNSTNCYACHPKGNGG